MNTKVNYLYRDASNYKTYNEAVLKGTLTENQVQRIYNALDSGLYFIPHQVGLDEDRGRGSYYTDDDHCWFELELRADDYGNVEYDELEGDFTLELTKAPPTVNMTAMEFVERMEEAAAEGWDETSWMDGMEYATFDELAESL